MEARFIRQGDVLLKKVSKDGKWQNKKSHILAYGEATSHHHEIIAPDSLEIGFLESGRDRFIKVPVESWLKHQEHECLKVPPGVYEIIIEQEYDYIKEQQKKVVD